MTSIFKTSREYPRMHVWRKFRDSSLTLWRVIARRSRISFPRIMSQNGLKDLEGQGQWPLFTIPTESVPWCMFAANLVIPAQISDELSCEQNKVYWKTDRRTDRRTGGRAQAATIPLMAKGAKIGRYLITTKHNKSPTVLICFKHGDNNPKHKRMESNRIYYIPRI